MRVEIVHVPGAWYQKTDFMTYQVIIVLSYELITKVRDGTIYKNAMGRVNKKTEAGSSADISD